MKETKMKLDELEFCIQFLQIYNPELKNAKYQDLADILEIEFKQKVDVEDVYLLYEPTVEQLQMESEIYYGSMFSYTNSKQFI